MNSPPQAIAALESLPKKLNTFTPEDEKKLSDATHYFEHNHAQFTSEEVKEMFK